MPKEHVDPTGQAVTDLIDIWEGKKPAAKAEIAGDQELTNDQRRRLPYIVALTRMPCYLCEANPPQARFYTFRVNDHVTPWKIIGVCKECALLPDVREQ